LLTYDVEGTILTIIVVLYSPQETGMIEKIVVGEEPTGKETGMIL